MKRYWALTLGLVLGAAFMPYFGSHFEYLYAPIFTDTKISNIELEEDGDLCWDWSFTKVRHARPLGFHYTATSVNLDEYPVVFRRRDIPVSTVERPMGYVIDRFCVRLPRGVTTGARVKLSGYAVYTVSHGLWVVRQPLPTILHP